ncbi:hypothetical protein BU23DRAFT_654241 [Bimuria novae-zelandiae CBS 107.79]|uniref:Uncharacterized protein n=1 Tax=Bimuria novae-zelandiae CBS 107.79 TaxID=1447943 RepID=A0A6A5VLA4_9PLEO|nr:hypothetical protein BU23DRAFT_654241 [Bimuria novae-zelandiae CBS 107.79]
MTMAANLPPFSRRLTINTHVPRPLSQHRRSPHQYNSPPVRHHTGTHFRDTIDIIPCTCSDSHIIAPPGMPCLADILKPPTPIPESVCPPSKRSSRSTPINDPPSPTSRWSKRTESFHSIEEPQVERQDDLAFCYYLPRISSTTKDHYTDAPWVAFDVRKSDEQTESEEMEFDLPFVQDKDFQYYPRKNSQVHGPEAARKEESSLVDNESGVAAPKEKTASVQVNALRKVLARVLGKLGLKGFLGF